MGKSDGIKSFGADFMVFDLCLCIYDIGRVMMALGTTDSGKIAESM